MVLNCNLVFAILILSYRRRQAAFEQGTANRQETLESALSAVQEKIENLPSVAVAPPSPKASTGYGLPASIRSKILKDMETGKTPEEIASALDLSLGAVQLVLAVRKFGGVRLNSDRRLA